MLHAPKLLADAPTPNKTPGLRKLTSLQEIDLSDNPHLRSVDAAAALPASLTALALTGCGLRRLPAGLEALPRLRQLFLSANDISSSGGGGEGGINNGADDPRPLLACPALVHAGLAFNRIAALWGPSLPPRPAEAALVSLDLSHNDISQLAPALDALAQLPRLRALGLHGNPAALLPCYRAAALARLPRLTYLDGCAAAEAGGGGGGGRPGSSSGGGRRLPEAAPDSGGDGTLPADLESACSAGGTHLLVELTELAVAPAFVARAFESIQAQLYVVSSSSAGSSGTTTTSTAGGIPSDGAAAVAKQPSPSRTSSAGVPPARGKPGRRTSSAAGGQRTSNTGTGGAAPAVGSAAAGTAPVLQPLHYYLELTDPVGES
jgi:hypothetical protein